MFVRDFWQQKSPTPLKLPLQLDGLRPFPSLEFYKRAAAELGLWPQTVLALISFRKLKTGCVEGSEVGAKFKLSVSLGNNLNRSEFAFGTGYPPSAPPSILRI